MPVSVTSKSSVTDSPSDGAWGEPLASPVTRSQTSSACFTSDSARDTSSPGAMARIFSSTEPFGVNLTALDMRLVTIWRILMSSPSSRWGTFGAMQ